MEIAEILPFIAGIASFLVAGGLVAWITKQPAGTKEMLDISNAVKEGASAFLKREMKIIVPVAIALTGSSAVAKAQQLMLEEIIVTAQKRVESLQDVPISITTMSGERIDETGITGLEELTQYMPNVTINNGAGTPNLFIRGVGSGTNAGFEQ